MIIINRWSPDSCDCTINFAWDDQVPAEQRVHTYVTPQQAAQLRPDALAMDALGTVTIKHSGNVLDESICGHHQEHKQKGLDMHAVLIEESRRKETMRAAVADQLAGNMQKFCADNPDVADNISVKVFKASPAASRFLLKQAIAAQDPELMKELAFHAANHVYSWSYDHQRVLHAKPDRLAPAQKKQLQGLADRTHGAGKVVVE